MLTKLTINKIRTQNTQLIRIIKIKQKKYPQTVRQNGRGNELEFGSLREELVIGALVEQYHVVHLLLLLSLAPLL
jgi:hypothetical protein